MKTLVLAVFLFASAAAAQTAQVIELSSEDAHEGMAKWQALQNAQREWDSFKKRIEKDYVSTHFGYGEKEETKVWDAFQFGFEFDPTFHFVVPKRPENTGVLTINGGGIYSLPCGTIPSSVPLTSCPLCQATTPISGIRYESITPPSDDGTILRVH